MDDTIRAPTPGLFWKLRRFLQWCVFAVLTLFALVALTELRKAGAPGAPLPLLYLSVVAACAIAAAHLPFLFGRLTRKAQLMAYAAIPAALILFSVYLGQMDPVWARTPLGAKEAADRARSQRQAAAEAARERTRLKAEQDAADREENAQRQASLEAQKPEMCELLVEQVVDGEKVLEINNVTVETSIEPNEAVTCSGDAITSQGEVEIEFGLVTTPQGKTLVRTRFP